MRGYRHKNLKNHISLVSNLSCDGLTVNRVNDSFAWQRNVTTMVALWPLAAPLKGNRPVSTLFSSGGGDHADALTRLLR